MNITSLDLHHITDTRDMYCSMPIELLINNQYIIIINQRNIFIITNQDGLNNIKNNYNEKYQCKDNQNIKHNVFIERGWYHQKNGVNYVNQYKCSNYFDYQIKHGEKLIRQFKDIKVLLVRYCCGRRDHLRINVPYEVVSQHFNSLICHKEILYWYMTLKNTILIYDVIFYIFKFIIK